MYSFTRIPSGAKSMNILDHDDYRLDLRHVIQPPGFMVVTFPTRPFSYSTTSSGFSYSEQCTIYHREKCTWQDPVDDEPTDLDLPSDDPPSNCDDGTWMGVNDSDLSPSPSMVFEANKIVAAYKG